MGFTINEQPLGSVVPRVASTPLRIEVQLADSDEPTASYRISLRRDIVGGGLEADTELTHADLIGDGTTVFNQFQHRMVDEYFLVQIVQTGGDGADVVWTAPIWLVDPSGVVDVHPSDGAVTGPPVPTHPVEFVWSQSSPVDHLVQCRVVQQIAAQNRRSGHQPPAGKRLHTGCPQ